jgi:hypothetical protein
LRQSAGAALVSLCLASAAADAAAGQLAVAWSDETSAASVRALYTREPWPWRRTPLAAEGSLFLRHAWPRLYAVSRTSGTITSIDLRRWRSRRTFELGSSSEPEDVAVVGRTMYVTRRRATRLLRLDLRTGTAQEAADFSAFADGDGIPDLGTMAVHEGRLFVQIRRANEDAPFGLEPPAYLAVVDVASGELIDTDPNRDGVQAIELHGTAPKQRMQVIEETRRLFVSATGAFFDGGGIEAIDLDGLRSAGLVLREADGMTGADLGAFVFVGPERGYLVYSTDLDLSSHLKPFSLRDGVEPGPELHVSVGYFVPSLEFDPVRNFLFVPDGAFDRRGVFVFDTSTNERLTPAPIGTSGMPTDILLLRNGRDR